MKWLKNCQNKNSPDKTYMRFSEFTFQMTGQGYVGGFQ